MSDNKSFGHSLKEALKSGGSWFVGGNAFLNGQTHPIIPFAYAALFTTQRVISHFYGEKVSNRIGKFLLGKQGPLFFNAVETGIVGGATQALHGSSRLVTACADFSAANGAQAVIYDGLIKFPSTSRGKLLKGFALAACEATILYGLSKVAENAGFSPQTAKEMVLPGIAFALTRAFKPQWLPPSLAYADMMAVAVATGIEGAATGHYLNAASRVFALAGFSRLAVARAQSEGKHSIFEVEHWIPKAIDNIQHRLTSAGLG